MALSTEALLVQERLRAAKLLIEMYGQGNTFGLGENYYRLGSIDLKTGFINVFKNGSASPIQFDAALTPGAVFMDPTASFASINPADIAGAVGPSPWTQAMQTGQGLLSFKQMFGGGQQASRGPAGPATNYYRAGSSDSSLVTDLAERLTQTRNSLADTSASITARESARLDFNSSIRFTENKLQQEMQWMVENELYQYPATSITENNIREFIAHAEPGSPWQKSLKELQENYQNRDVNARALAREQNDLGQLNAQIRRDTYQQEMAQWQNEVSLSRQNAFGSVTTAETARAAAEIRNQLSYNKDGTLDAHSQDLINTQIEQNRQDYFNARAAAIPDSVARQAINNFYDDPANNYYTSDRYLNSAAYKEWNAHDDFYKELNAPPQPSEAFGPPSQMEIDLQKAEAAARSVEEGRNSFEASNQAQADRLNRSAIRTGQLKFLGAAAGAAIAGSYLYKSARDLFSGDFETSELLGTLASFGGLIGSMKFMHSVLTTGPNGALSLVGQHLAGMGGFAQWMSSNQGMLLLAGGIMVSALLVGLFNKKSPEEEALEKLNSDVAPVVWNPATMLLTSGIALMGMGINLSPTAPMSWNYPVNQIELETALRRGTGQMLPTDPSQRYGTTFVLQGTNGQPTYVVSYDPHPTDSKKVVAHVERFDGNIRFTDPQGGSYVPFFVRQRGSNGKVTTSPNTNAIAALRTQQRNLNASQVVDPRTGQLVINAAGATSHQTTPTTGR